MSAPARDNNHNNNNTATSSNPSASSSSHRLSSATSSSFPNRKSSSALPSTSSGSPPRTQLSSPAPIPIPWQNYRIELVRRFSREGPTSGNAIVPARASDPEKHTATQEATGQRRRSARPPSQDLSSSIRRASYTSAIFRNLEENMAGSATDGQQWGPGNEQGTSVYDSNRHLLRMLRKGRTGGQRRLDLVHALSEKMLTVTCPSADHSDRCCQRLSWLQYGPGCSTVTQSRSAQYW